jgi:2-haloalkanoic acid dehalogenase type II
VARFDWITFDCYGTLIDWELGISLAFAQTAARQRESLDVAAVLKAYADVEPLVEAGPYRRYREVLAATAVRVAKRLGWAELDERAAFLAESLPSWPPFPDTNPALRRLAGAGVRLGILSNVDDDLLAGTRRHLEVPFDLIVTAEQVRSYKPAHGHFTAARTRLPDGALWLHAAQSYFHDVVPCLEMGVPVAWINRKGQDAGAGGPPNHEFRDLTALADWVLEVQSSKFKVQSGDNREP